MAAKASGSPRRIRSMASCAPLKASGFIAAARIIPLSGIRMVPPKRPIRRNPAYTGGGLRSMALEINQKEVAPATAVIRLEGNVMRGPDGERIEAVLNGALAQGLRRIVFDMTGVKRIDSTGIGRFIYCLNKVQESGGKLWMAGAQGYVRECFRVTRLDTIFQFCGTVEDALAANQGG